MSAKLSIDSHQSVHYKNAGCASGHAAEPGKWVSHGHSDFPRRHLLRQMSPESNESASVGSLNSTSNLSLLPVLSNTNALCCGFSLCPWKCHVVRNHITLSHPTAPGKRGPSQHGQRRLGGGGWQVRGRHAFRSSFKVDTGTHTHTFIVSLFSKVRNIHLCM